MAGDSASCSPTISSADAAVQTVNFAEHFWSGLQKCLQGVTQGSLNESVGPTTEKDENTALPQP